MQAQAAKDLLQKTRSTPVAIEDAKLKADEQKLQKLEQQKKATEGKLESKIADVAAQEKSVGSNAAALKKTLEKEMKNVVTADQKVSNDTKLERQTKAELAEKVQEEDEVALQARDALST